MKLTPILLITRQFSELVHSRDELRERYEEFVSHDDYLGIDEFRERMLAKIAHLYATVDLTPDEQRRAEDIKAAVAALSLPPPPSGSM